MKRISYILAALILLAAMAYTVSAADEGTITVGKITVETVTQELASVNADTEIEVKINLDANPGVTSFAIDIAYDSNLEIVDGVDSEFMGDPATLDEDTWKNMNPLTLSWEDDLAKEDVTFTGTVFTLKFKFKNVPSSTGLVPVTVTYDPSSMLNAEDAQVAFTTVDGGIDLTLSKMTGVGVSARGNLVYTGEVQYSKDLINITGAPTGYTPTYEPESFTGTYDGSVSVKINAPGYEEYPTSIFLHIEKAKAVISGVVAKDKAKDDTKDVILEVVDPSGISGLVGSDAVIPEYVAGYTFTGLLADAEIGKNKPVVGVKNAADVLGNAAAANYDLVIAEGITANVTKTPLLPVNAASITDFSKVQVTAGDGSSVEVNLNKSASKGEKIDNGDGTHTLKFVAAFTNKADAENYDSTVEVIVPDASIVTVTADPNMTLGTIDNLPINETTKLNDKGYFIKRMEIVFSATAIKSGYRLNRIEPSTLYLDPKDATNAYTVNAVFTKKTAVYPAPGTDKNIIEQTKSNKIVLTIGSTEATVFGTKKINDVAPIIINDRTMLPARFVAEALGAKVEWDDAAKKVSIFKDMKKIEIYIGKAEAYINGQAYTLDSPAIIQNSRTYMPLRFIAESLGANVKWNDVTRQVVITK